MYLQKVNKSSRLHTHTHLRPQKRNFPNGEMSLYHIINRLTKINELHSWIACAVCICRVYQQIPRPTSWFVPASVQPATLYNGEVSRCPVKIFLRRILSASAALVLLPPFVSADNKIYQLNPVWNQQLFLFR